MSWQSYVDNQICSQVQCKFAVIAGLNDGSVWAKFEKDPNAPVTQAELKVICDGLKNNHSNFPTTGIKLGGENYLCLLAEESLLRGRKGGCALTVVATTQCLIAAATVDGVQPGQLNMVVEKLGDYLKGNNY